MNRTARRPPRARNVDLSSDGSSVLRILRLAAACLKVAWLNCKIAWYESEERYCDREIERHRRTLTDLQIREARSRFGLPAPKRWFS